MASRGKDDDDVVVGRDTMLRSQTTPVPENFLHEDLDDAAREYLHHVPRDETLTSRIFFEPSFEGGGNISPHGLHFIANHKYRPSAYTILDNFLNPMWTYLTELLPMWLAPNLVTTIGGLHCGMAYALLWYYCPDFDETPPDWVMFLAGYCTIAYYTLDCMDGKQARRTGSSSPLGQLFDHGFDCICALFFLSTIASYLLIGGTYWYVFLQTTIQFSFFMAQWEEYHTHVLPHSVGGCWGVTEVNYSLGILAIANSFLDREAVYQQRTEQALGGSLSQFLPAAVKDMEWRYFLLSCNSVMLATMMILSIRRVMLHPNIVNGPPGEEPWKRRLAAMSKLASPFALCVAAFAVPPDAVRSRYITVTFGLAISLLTKKMIVFSMAKMAFAVVQWDAVPFLIAAAWIRYADGLSKAEADFGLGMLCFWYAFRLMRWVNVTINQICKKLDIYCLRLKKKKDS